MVYLESKSIIVLSQSYLSYLIEHFIARNFMHVVIIISVS